MPRNIDYRWTIIGLLTCVVIILSVLLHDSGVKENLTASRTVTVMDSTAIHSLALVTHERDSLAVVSSQHTYRYVTRTLTVVDHDTLRIVEQSTDTSHSEQASIQTVTRVDTLVQRDSVSVHDTTSIVSSGCHLSTIEFGAEASLGTGLSPAIVASGAIRLAGPLWAGASIIHDGVSGWADIADYRAGLSISVKF